eukprot:m.177554 g.177554  ORF g.177554 m.177554 type:complete len:177 (+) comp17967_c0_seq11:199-729(+)
MAAAADAKSKARLYMRTRAQDHVLEVGQMLQRTVKNSGSSETLMRAAKQFAARDSSIAATRSVRCSERLNSCRVLLVALVCGRNNLARDTETNCSCFKTCLGDCCPLATGVGGYAKQHPEITWTRGQNVGERTARALDPACAGNQFFGRVIFGTVPVTPTMTRATESNNLDRRRPV